MKYTDLLVPKYTALLVLACRSMKSRWKHIQETHNGAAHREEWMEYDRCRQARNFSLYILLGFGGF